MHEEVSCPTHHSNVPGLHHNGVSSHEVQGALKVCAVENKCEPQPSSEGVFGVIYVHALCSTNWFGVEVVVKSNGVIKNHHIAKMELICQDGKVSPLGCTHNCRSGISCILAIVDNIMEIQDHLLTWFVLLLLALIGRRKREDEHQEEKNYQTPGSHSSPSLSKTLKKEEEKKIVKAIDD